MKKQIFTISLSVLSTLCAIGLFSFKSPEPDNNTSGHTVYMYKQITTVESVVPGGMGRSRILSTDDNGQMLEKELKNFYSMVGINFDNIANNDRVIVDRLNDYSAQGWELVNVTTGSNQQSSGGSSSGGLFITRYVFRKAK
ncbi:MAG: hypothetical protein JWQ38_2310 [Flavipsychrobacter sp.]|nr:hypothetical protein [Flavipsychrobacter sp.]